MKPHEPLFFLPRQLQLACWLKGLPHALLADRTGISYERLYNLMRDTDDISNGEADVLCLVLGVAPSFYTTRMAIEPPLFFCRKRTASLHTFQALIATVSHIRHQVETMLRPVTLKPALPLISRSVSEQISPKDIAEECRMAWRLPPGCVESCIGLAEMLGIVVVPSVLPGIMTAAITTHTKNKVPIIVYDHTKLPNHICFALMREVGHLVMHKVPNDEAYLEASDFAAEMLDVYDYCNSYHIRPQEELNAYYAKRLGSPKALRRLLHLWDNHARMHCIDACGELCLTQQQYAKLIESVTETPA